MHIVIAPNAFKNSMSATAVAAAIKQGLSQSKLDCTTTCFPIADGGDGTGGLIVETCRGTVILNDVHDPLGRKITASFGLIENGKTAVIEMADATGLRLLNEQELTPLLASSYGTGELIKFALDAGVNKIIIAMGGSATVDAGCGILSALGMTFLDADGNRLRAIPQELINLNKIDSSGLDKRIFDCELVVLCDVDNPLLGPQGAAAVFSPQKGATSFDVRFLDRFLTAFAEISATQTGINIGAVKHSATAGGAAAGLHLWCNARLINGIEYFLLLTKFNDTLAGTDLVITGEGSIDLQTIHGKGPYGVAVMAKNKGIPVVGLAGSIPLEPDAILQQYFDVLISINHNVTDLHTAMVNTFKNLVRTAKAIGDLLAIKKI